MILLILIALSGCSLQGRVANVIKEEKYERAFVNRVIDGDTFVLRDNRHVRITCINTPEKGEFYYKEATDFLKSKVLNKEVFLEKDIGNKDKYGRLLRYVRDVNDQHLINYDEVINGYARLDRIPPNVKHCPEFEAAEKIAKEKKSGIWSEV